MIVYWHDNTNRVIFEGSYGIVADFIKGLPKDAVYIDIGANQGGTAILASQCLKKAGGGKVLAFEPAQDMYNLLIKNANINNCDNVIIFNKAIARKKSKLNLIRLKETHSGGSYISNGEPNNSSVESIEAVTLSALEVKHYGKNIFLKIDTEGYEMEVLNGLRELFDESLVKSVCIEINSKHLDRFQSQTKEIYQFMKAYNFSFKFGYSSGHYDEIFTLGVN